MNPFGQQPTIPLEFLGIGEGRVYQNLLRVQTLLGSCVAVTLHCRRTGVGGIFHGLLPSRSPFDSKDDGQSPYRFVDAGIEALRLEMALAGADMRTLVAKVFGGANSLNQEVSGVGHKNVLTAFNTLAGKGIRVAASNVGGDRGRKLLFLPSSGEVYVKMLNRPPEPTNKG